MTERKKTAVISQKRLYIPEAIEQWETIKKQIGDYINAYRRKQKLSPEQMAKKLFITEEKLKRIEGGRLQENFQFFLKILILLNISLKVIIFEGNESIAGENTASP